MKWVAKILQTEKNNELGAVDAYLLEKSGVLSNLPKTEVNNILKYVAAKYPNADNDKKTVADAYSRRTAAIIYEKEIFLNSC